MSTASKIIRTPAITELVVEGRRLLGMVVVSEKAAQVKRMELGRFLLKVRAMYPKRGTAEHGWGSFLEAIELDETTAFRYMKLAEATLSFSEKDRDRIPTYADLGLDKRESPQPDPDAPPPADHDAPFQQLAVEDAVAAVEAAAVAASDPDGDHDTWCTPQWIVDALPELDLDPCTNPWAVVRARVSYMVEAGQDGLALPWFGMVFVNPPYSKPLPWAQKLDTERKRVEGCAFLMNTAGDTAWWQLLANHLPLRLDFNKRIQFIATTGLKTSSNDRPQTMLMDAAFWAKCDQEALLSRGTLWERR